MTRVESFPVCLIAGLTLLWSLPALGQSRGVLTLKTLGGAALADGDLSQDARGDRVTIRLVFHFKDGSIHDETVVYSPTERIRLSTYHLIQTGRAFPQPLDLSVDGKNGDVTVRYTQDGKQKVETDHIDVAADLANGLIPTLLRNAHPGHPSMAFPFVVATPKPRLVKLVVSTAGDDSFPIGGALRKATHYVVKVEVGGLPGLVVPLLGKQPPDSHVWMLTGEAPAFVKSEQPFYVGGPLWRIELLRYAPSQAR